MTTTLTDAQHRALKILKDHGPIAPRYFAEHMWPDSPAWRKHYKMGNKGTRKGAALWKAAGAYLGKLAAKGWARRETPLGRAQVEYRITGTGLNALANHNNQAP